MTRENDLRKIRELLQRRRRSILESTRGANSELESLKDQERDPEFEENAQSELADYTLSSLVENQRRELLMIDSALRRLDEGAFGECIDCGDDIPVERLEVLPFALRCEEDATRLEQKTRGETYTAPSL